MIATKAMIARLLYGGPGGPEWAILSSDQSKLSDHKEQVANRRALRGILVSRAYEYVDVEGYWGGQQESAVLILGMQEGEVNKLALYFDQQAYLAKSGLYVRVERGWYVRKDIRTKILLLGDGSDGSLNILVDRTVIPCTDGRLTLICEIGSPSIYGEG